MNNTLLTFYFGVYIDRALTSLALKVDEVPDSEGNRWTFDEWFSGGGDLERVGRTHQIAQLLAERLDFTDLGLSEVCYIVLEENLVEFIESFVGDNKDSPTNTAIFTFIQNQVQKMK